MTRPPVFADLVGRVGGGGGHQSSPSWLAWARPSAIRLVAMVKMRDHQHRRHHRPGLGLQAEPVLVHHLAPVGRTRVGGEAQEAQGGDHADRVGEPQAGLGQQRAGHVGQHLGDDHAGPLLAQRLGGDHEVAGDDAERDAAGDAGHARGVRGADEQDDHPRGGVLQRGEHHQGQQDLREGQQHVVEPHDHLVPPAAGVGRDDADEDAEHHAEQRWPAPRSPGRSGRRASPGSARPGRGSRCRRRPSLAYGAPGGLLLAVRREERREDREQHHQQR